METLSVPGGLAVRIDLDGSVTSSMSPPISIRILTVDELDRWLAHATPGDRVTYFRGFLVMDRGACSRLGQKAGEELDRVANAVMDLAEAGRIHLVQHRHGPNDYTYVGVRARGGWRYGSDRPARETSS